MPPSVDRRVRILSICDRDRLRTSRERELKSAGYEVDSVSSNEFLRFGQVRSSAIAIICTTVNPESALRLKHLLPSYNPEIRILHLDGAPEIELRPDRRAHRPAGPGGFLQTVESMAAGN
jgi:hypothetical protein